MRIAFVLRGYWDRPYRTLAAVLGVALPIVSMLIQFGFYDAVMTTATHFYQNLRFDLLLSSPDYLEFSQPGSIPRESLTRALSVQGVRQSQPVFISIQSWRVPQTDRIHQILVLGIDPLRNPFAPIGQEALLQRRDTLEFDRNSRPALGNWAKGMVAEVGGRALDVVDTFAFGPGFNALGLCVVSDRTFDRLQPFPDRVSLGLIQLDGKVPGDVVAEHLRRLLAPDVRVATRAQVFDGERSYWRSATSLGINLSVGCGIVLLVGIVVIYNILSSDIANRLTEYATLKAIGFDDAALGSLVRLQAVGFALLAIPLALGLAEAGYWLTRRETFLPVQLTWSRSIAALGLGVVISLLAAQLAIGRLKRADPGDLF